MTHLEKVLEDYRSTAYHTRDLGDKFERLIKRFLEVDPMYKDIFSNVWLWKDFPERNGEQDTGIDIVARERLGGGSFHWFFKEESSYFEVRLVF